MNPRERWLAVLNGRRPDRTPCDYWGTAEITDRLKKDLGCADERALWERLGIDKCIYLSPCHPRSPEKTWHLQSHFAVWHVETQAIGYGENLGKYQEDAFHPLAEAGTVADIEAFDWPDAADFDIAALRREAQKWAGYPILGASSEPFYLYCRLRGMERAMEDMVQRPEMAEAVLERIFRFDYELIRRVLTEAGDLVDLIYVAEDLGTQQSLLLSPATIRQRLLPRMKRIVDLVHSCGKFVFHHDDGAIRKILPDLVATGIDLLNPIQWRCRGMEREALARDFGPQVVFHGGIDNQQTLPFGRAEEVRAEVRDNLRLLAGGRGYIVAPCHNLQANTPTENVLALYEAVREFG